ncbi:chemotaxis protein CheD [Leeia sp. TBRC 13508]|uniref:Probable chemoreceptor glutamine deamidase CheD n=1 Tax=Leeia speluncae TaxID=2884804 RepID=A0ABS8D6Z2_9NEIS|nr:chemotaxis protein CheD [Leeia speluncae]MCB6183965.1 chemotaxis protein CheD [Leeia speluncae]
MHPPRGFIEIFLQPGDWYFADELTRIRTILGSCVSIVMWHPRLHLGGMCHYMLPTRKHQQVHELDGRYADEAIALLIDSIKEAGTSPKEYTVRMFGGGDMFPHLEKHKISNVGQNNVIAGRKLLAAHGLKITDEHVEGAGHRNVSFDVWDGNVTMKQSMRMELGPPRVRSLSK